MLTLFIIIGILLILIIGFVNVNKRYSHVVSNIEFATIYRSKFIDLANKFFQNSNNYNGSETVDNELYIWLTLNVSKMQSKVGTFGIMSYQPAFANYMINNYQIIVNTLPKFRERQVQNFDTGSVDDCLLRYIGYLEEIKKEALYDLKNPIAWFREGFKDLITAPLLILSSFGILSRGKVSNIKENAIFKVLTGVTGFVTFIGGLVTIIVGYDQTIKFIARLF